MADFSLVMACHGQMVLPCSRAARLVAVLLLHRFDDGHAEVDVGDTVIAFFIHLLSKCGFFKKCDKFMCV